MRTAGGGKRSLVGQQAPSQSTTPRESEGLSKNLHSDTKSTTEIDQSVHTLINKDCNS